MGRPRVHGDDTRAALLAAAAEILDADGPAAVTVRRVAAAAGTTTRAVYSLFGDRGGLLHAMFVDIAAAMRAYHEAVPTDPDDPSAELVPLALAYRAAALDRPHEYELYVGGVPGLELTDDDLTLALRSFDRVLDTIARCVANGTFTGDVRGIGLQMFAQVHGLASLELRGMLGTPAEAEQRWRGALTAAIAGYRAEAAAVGASG